MMKKKINFSKVFKADPKKAEGVLPDYPSGVISENDHIIMTGNDSSEPVEVCVRPSKKKISSRRIKSESGKKQRGENQ